MTYWKGFAAGVITGIFVTLFATGHIIAVTMTEFVRSICIFILFMVFMIGLIITFLSAKWGHSVFDPTTDGFIVGMGWANALIIFLLYGFRI